MPQIKSIVNIGIKGIPKVCRGIKKGQLTISYKPLLAWINFDASIKNKQMPNKLFDYIITYPSPKC